MPGAAFMCETDGFNRPIEFEPESTPPKNFDRPIESAAPPGASDPTRETYRGWSDAYDFFNVTLFGGELPPCLITYQRSRKFYGYFAGDRFVDTDLRSSTAHIVDEIAINPAFLREQLTEHALSVLAHEMAHLKRHRMIQPPPTPGYHDKQWAAIMVDIGLIPSTTGEPGGKTTGQKVRHYVIVGGRFSLAAQELLRRGFKIRYLDREQPSPDREQPPAPNGDTETRIGGDNRRALRRARSNASKTPFSCIDCKPPENFWGKPGSDWICGRCNTRAVPSSPGGAK
jgi:hypothetical protein